MTWFKSAIITTGEENFHETLKIDGYDERGFYVLEKGKLKANLQCVNIMNPSFSAKLKSQFVNAFAPLTDSVLVEAAHQPQFPCPKVSRKTG